MWDNVHDTLRSLRSRSSCDLKLVPAGTRTRTAAGHNVAGTGANVVSLMPHCFLGKGRAQTQPLPHAYLTAASCADMGCHYV
jgi:hypothetical protein